MRIISKFKDYYDCMQNYYHDDMLYIRNTEYLDKTKNTISSDRPWISEFVKRDFCSRFYSKHNKELRDYYYSAEITIGFCGKFYHPFVIGKHVNRYNEFEKGIEHICYFKEDVIKYFPDVANKLLDYWKDSKGRSYFDLNESQEKNDAIFLAKKCPIFIDMSNYTVYNGRLADYGFQKVFPPAQAYQELMMYFGSVLSTPEKPIPKIDDKTMAEAKGFNKYSFRKDKCV